MKEILNNICKNALEDAYQEHLNFILGSFFKKNSSHQYKLQNYLEQITPKIFDTIISNDFTVSKMQCSMDNLKEIESNTFFGNFSPLITIYNIKEKNINIVYVSNESYFFLGDSILSLVENNISELYHDSKENFNISYETFESIYSTDDTIVLIPSCDTPTDVTNFTLKPEKYQGIVNIQYVLNLLYGENKKTQNYQKILENNILKAHSIISRKLSELYNENKQKFLDITISTFLTNTTFPFNENEKQNIYDYLIQNKDINKIIQLILTFQYTSQLHNATKYHEHLGFSTSDDFLDFSFIAVQIFKLVEIVFHNLLTDFWNTKSIMDTYGWIDLSDDKLNLGKMEQFFETPDPEIAKHLSKKYRYTEELVPKLKKWIKKTRNGFLHKHILPESLLSDSVTDSIDITCLLILTLMK